MRSITLILFSVIFIAHSCTFSSKEEIPHEEQRIKEIEQIIDTFDSETTQKKTIIIDSGEKKLKTLTLFHDNKTPYKLIIETIYGSVKSKEYIYFGDKNGFPLIYSFNLRNNKSSVQAVFRNRDVISYIKSTNDSKLNNLDSFIKETKISALLFIAQNNLSNFDDIQGINGPKPSLNSMPVIRVVTDSLNLYEEPNLNSNLITSITNDEVLFYLGDSTLSNTDEYWFYVALENKTKNGWIQGGQQNIDYISRNE